MNFVTVSLHKNFYIAILVYKKTLYIQGLLKEIIMAVNRVENTCETQQILTKAEAKATSETNEPLPLVDTEETEATPTGMDKKTQIKLKEEKLKELETELTILQKKQNILYSNSKTNKIGLNASKVGLAAGGIWGILGGIACKSIPAAVFYGVPGMVVLGGIAMIGSHCLLKHRQNHPEKIKSPEEREIMTQINETQAKIDAINEEMNNIKTELEEIYRYY